MNKKYSIAVWDVQFYKVDEDGNELLNEDGSVKLFTEGGNGDLSYIAEHVTDDELLEIE
tara:strand:- start:2227 stop:2403 length:177 start_codon:yes stop_codon:yes gene_type:complete